MTDHLDRLIEATERAAIPCADCEVDEPHACERAYWQERGGVATKSERTIVVTYEPGTATVRSMRPNALNPRADADALRRAADVIDSWADRDAETTHPTSPSAQCRGEGRGGAVSEGEGA